MRKIIFFSKNLNVGGMEKSLVRLLNSLVKYYKITLVVEEKGVLVQELDDKIMIQEYKISKSKNVILRKIKNFSKRLKWSIKNFKKYDFACNYATYSVLGSRLAHVSAKNNAFYVHSNYYEMMNKNEKLIKDFFNPHKLNKFSKIIFVSNESKEGFEKVYPELKEKFTVINNLIDDKRVLSLAQEKCNLKYEEKDVKFVYVGRLDNEAKNLELLLNSFKEVVLADVKYKLFIVGNGPYKESIIRFIEDYNLGSNIFLLDETTNPYPYIKRCDSLILTSNYEGFPVVYLEALVLDKRIMSTIWCSDEVIDMRDYMIKLEKDKDDVVRKILGFRKEKVNYKLDFKKFNEIKIKKIRKIIER